MWYLICSWCSPTSPGPPPKRIGWRQRESRSILIRDFFFLLVIFKVTKRDEDSSLMQLKEEFRSYEALRREHDAQIVHIAMEAGLRISPEQWSSLLYGDLAHKSHMQSIIDKVRESRDADFCHYC